MQIGDVKLDGNVFLAPMAGFTDYPFRLLCKEQGASLVYTEMISVKAMHYDDETTLKLSQTHPNELLVAVQIFGNEPELMAEAASRFSDRDDISIIDINMGCPAPKIVKNQEGSALMRKPELVRQIVRATVKASRKPVTVKIRKGWDGNSINALEIATICEEEGAKAVTVHGRTREQYYSGKADWSIIKEVKRALNIPVIGNGDIKLPEDAKRLLEETGCDEVMVGRSAQGNPWLFGNILAYLKTGYYDKTISPKERLDTILRHYYMMIDYKGERTAILEMRKHVACYLHGLPESAKIKNEIFREEAWEEVKKILQEYLINLDQW